LTTVLLTLGRLPKALALARACRAAGCRVLVADPFRWHLCRPSRAVDRCYRVTAPNTSLSAYLDDLEAIVRDESVDLVLPVSEEALHVAELAPRLPSGVRLWSASQELLGSLHHKREFVDLALSRGLAVPETYAADDPAAALLAKRSAYVEKPVHSCSGIGLRFAQAGDPVLAQSADAVVQERLDGDHISSLSLVDRGREIATIFYRGRVFSGTVAICFERVDEAPDARAWISRFVDGLDYSGFMAFDFIIADDGIARAIECNPRATSGVHFFEPAALGAALLDPSAATAVEPAQSSRFQWAYSTLTEAYAAVFGRGSSGAALARCCVPGT
jgi:hypothetical protein